MHIPCFSFTCGKKAHGASSPSADKELSVVGTGLDAEIINVLVCETNEDPLVDDAASIQSENKVLPTLLQAPKAAGIKHHASSCSLDASTSAMASQKEQSWGSSAMTSSWRSVSCGDMDDDLSPVRTSPVRKSCSNQTISVALPVESARRQSRRTMTSRSRLRKRYGTAGSDSRVYMKRRNRTAFFLMRTDTFIKRTTTGSSRFLPAHSESLQFEVVEPKRPADQRPVVTTHLRGVTVADLRAAIEGPFEQSPWQRVLAELLGCDDIVAEPWVQSSDESAAQRIRYVMPVPNDLPDAIARLVNIPPTVPGVTISFVSSNMDPCKKDDELIVVQRSCSEGVLYSNRLRIQHTYSFRPHPSGGVQCRQWAESIWLEQLPWTHRFISGIVAKKVQAEAIALAPQMSRIFEDAAAAAPKTNGH